ncbi:hypothetical protein R69746_05643 [Paraburkholderia aspalathi]|nr:hypothetical protein R69746_05643 [Paraburkholderia aspalathi]
MRAYWRDARDPAIVLEEKQNATCLGCEQLERSRWSGTTKYVCSIGGQKASTDIYEMQRCKKYSDGVNMTLEQSQQIEELLLNWYRWQIAASDAELMALYYKPVDRTCREAEIPTDDEELIEQSYQWVDDQQAAQMDTLMDDLSHRGTLTGEMRAAISTSMRNKQNGHKVWSSARVLGQHHVYQEAKQAMLPMLILRNLVKIVESV